MIIDSPPSLGVLTLNVLVAADRVIVPLPPEYYALEGITYLMATIDRVKSTLNPNLTVQGIVLTMWDPRNRLARGRGASTPSLPRVRLDHSAQRPAERAPARAPALL